MRNARQAERHPIVLPIRVVLPREGGSIDGLTRNISLGGVFIDVEQTIALGTQVHLKFTVETSKDPIEVGAVVRWTDIGGVGAQFDGLRARDVYALGKLFEKPTAG